MRIEEMRIELNDMENLNCLSIDDLESIIERIKQMQQVNENNEIVI